MVQLQHHTQRHQSLAKGQQKIVLGKAASLALTFFDATISESSASLLSVKRVHSSKLTFPVCDGVSKRTQGGHNPKP